MTTANLAQPMTTAAFFFGGDDGDGDYGADFFGLVNGDQTHIDALADALKEKGALGSVSAAAATLSRAGLGAVGSQVAAIGHSLLDLDFSDLIVAGWCKLAGVDRSREAHCRRARQRAGRGPRHPLHHLDAQPTGGSAGKRRSGGDGSFRSVGQVQDQGTCRHSARRQSRAARLRRLCRNSHTRGRGQTACSAGGALSAATARASRQRHPAAARRRTVARRHHSRRSLTAAAPHDAMRPSRRG
jgi:hypothetical protein